ncbi:hypothetical protein [Micromonospora sp. WMMD980]|nr:hypothetical protein [Micromonospora sp. WMMD980]MDG4804699.1 hypothetical protein [Micromonospora sp. WMMD980]
MSPAATRDRLAARRLNRLDADRGDAGPGGHPGLVEVRLRQEE